MRGLRTLRRTAVCLAFATGAALFGAPLLSSPAQATPVRGTTGWSVLLCKYADVTAEPRAPQFFREMFTTAGNGLGGLADWFRDQSGGRTTLDGSVVRGWYTMSTTKAQAQAQTRGARIQSCVDAAARGGYAVPAGFRTVAITNAQVDSGAAGGRVLLDPGAWNVAFASHEMSHGYGLGHSFSNDTSYQNASWSQPGEYDDMWDQMSAMHVYSFATARFGAAGTGLNAFHRDEKGWLARNRVLTIGADGVGSRTVSIAPLEAPQASTGPLLVRVPFDPADKHHYYTVEYRRKLGWSAGIPADTVLIHEVRNGTPTLLRQLGIAGKPAVTSWTGNGVRISTTGTAASSATVSITSDVVQRCLQGWVWREANANDRVCVTGATRSQVRADNAAASSRWTNGPYGPHTCINGYVWREAFSGDDVCVTGAQRDQARADNAQAAARRNPARFVFGPNNCASGWVWREADLADYVCVSGATRTQVRSDNSVASTRWTNGAYGPHTCISGYVWREAFPGDDVCVTGAQRTHARSDNSQAGARVERVDG